MHAAPIPQRRYWYVCQSGQRLLVIQGSRRQQSQSLSAEIGCLGRTLAIVNIRTSPEPFENFPLSVPHGQCPAQMPAVSPVRCPFKAVFHLVSPPRLYRGLPAFYAIFHVIWMQG